MKPEVWVFELCKVRKWLTLFVSLMQSRRKKYKYAKIAMCHTFCLVESVYQMPVNFDNRSFTCVRRADGSVAVKIWLVHFLKSVLSKFLVYIHLDASLQLCIQNGEDMANLKLYMKYKTCIQQINSPNRRSGENVSYPLSSRRSHSAVCLHLAILYVFYHEQFVMMGRSINSVNICKEFINSYGS